MSKPCHLQRENSRPGKLPLSGNGEKAEKGFQLMGEKP
jgi:hypothetical protein